MTTRFSRTPGVGYTGTGGVPRPSANTPYHPHMDTATFRDLLLFEERLKMNAEMLRKRKRRYSAFLWTFVFALIWLIHRLLIIPPQNLLAFRAVQASIAVVVITLVLFFASGMYEEKIKYAHSYINHSNKALRPLNMHLNMRRPHPTFPIPFIRPSTAKPMSIPPPKQPSRRASSTASTVLATIPPSTNPRGELIFSSRVDKSFREGYERYRAAFERRREEKAREEARRNARWYNVRMRRQLSPLRGFTPTPIATPPGSRRGTPPPGLDGSSYTGRSPSPGVRSGLRNETGRNEGGEEKVQVRLDYGERGKAEAEKGKVDGEKRKLEGGGQEKRERAESYSFVWTREEEAMPRRAP